MGAVTLGELITYLGGASGTTVLVFLLYKLMNGDLIPKPQHEREMGQVRQQLEDERAAHRDQVALLRLQVEAEAEEGRTWRDMALRSVGIAEITVQKSAK